MKLLLKRTGAVMAASFIALFLYANLRQPSLTEQMAPVHLKIFSLDRVPAAHELEAVKTTLQQQPGVTAVSFGADGETFSVTYRPDECTPVQLLAAASLNGSFEAVEKTFPPRPACPVPPLDGLKREVLKTLRIF